MDHRARRRKHAVMDVCTPGPYCRTAAQFRRKLFKNAILRRSTISNYDVSSLGAISRERATWIGGVSMRVLTDDPDWAPDIYEARVRALALLRRCGRAQLVGTPWRCLEADRGGIVVTIYPQRSPILLTIDAPGESAEPFGRVFAIQYESSNAWRIIVDVYHPGPWQRRLKKLVHPRPWLERWRALATFTGTLPQRPPPSANIEYGRADRRD
jgi:hypothetical protein